MAIRIWHQSFTVLSDLAAYDEALRDHFQKRVLIQTDYIRAALKAVILGVIYK